MINLYYFRHLPAERESPKMKKLLDRYGMAGYGFYWLLCEELYFTPPHQFQLTDLRLRHLAKCAGIRAFKAKRMLIYMISSGLFTMRGAMLCSLRVDEEVREVATALDRKKDSARRAGLASAAKRKAGGAA